ncbi:hypothetical protein, partial [Staphylococcus aureus]|uniref:hypothetical protein n=2 Tax=Staphylococcus aureus TaxID=1280 RepID=UPI001CA5967B
IYSSTSMSTLGFIDINKAPFKVFIFSMSTLKGEFQCGSSHPFFAWQRSNLAERKLATIVAKNLS